MLTLLFERILPSIAFFLMLSDLIGITGSVNDAASKIVISIKFSQNPVKATLEWTVVAVFSSFFLYLGFVFVIVVLSTFSEAMGLSSISLFFCGLLGNADECINWSIYSMGLLELVGGFVVFLAMASVIWRQFGYGIFFVLYPIIAPLSEFRRGFVFAAGATVTSFSFLWALWP